MESTAYSALRLTDFELAEIERLNQIIKSLAEMLHAVGVDDVWIDSGGEITVVNEALESLHPISLGVGYMGLGADGT